MGQRLADTPVVVDRLDSWAVLAAGPGPQAPTLPSPAQPRPVHPTCATQVARRRSACRRRGPPVPAARRCAAGAGVRGGCHRGPRGRQHVRPPPGAHPATPAGPAAHAAGPRARLRQLSRRAALRRARRGGPALRGGCRAAPLGVARAAGGAGGGGGGHVCRWRRRRRRQQGAQEAGPRGL